MNSVKTKKKNGIKYIVLNDGNIIREDEKNNTYRQLSLIDIENFENGNIIQIDRNYYYLLGDKLYSLNNRMMLDADWKLSKKAKVVDLIDYIKSRSYLEYKTDDKTFQDNDLFHSIFLKAYNKVIINDALSFLDFDKNNKYITDFKNYNYAYYSLRNIVFEKEIEEPFDWYIKDNVVEYFYDKDYCLTFKNITEEFDNESNITLSKIYKIKTEIEEELLKRESSDYSKSFIEEIRQINNKKIEEKKNIYEEKFSFQNVLNNIYKDDVRNQLDAGFWVLKEFMYNYGLNGKNKDAYRNKKVPGNDYSFLIINFIKASEIFLYNKLSNLNNKELSLNTTLGDMIQLIDKNKHKHIKNCLEHQQKKNFIRECYDFKNLARNGNFHKHSVETFEKAEEIILNTIQFLIRIEMYIK